MLRDGRADGLAKLRDHGIYVGEKVAVGLGAAAERLFERLPDQRVQLAQVLREQVEGRQAIGDIVHSDERWVAFEPALRLFRVPPLLLPLPTAPPTLCPRRPSQ